MSKITNDGLTRSGTGCFIAVPINQSINQSIFRVAYVTNSYHKDHARKKVNLEDKARIGEWKKMQF